MATPQTKLLTFPLSNPSTSILPLANPTSTPMAFKVKTTNPARYVVRPNLGALAPGAALDITIALHRSTDRKLDADLNPGPSRDKFLLQTAPAPRLTSTDDPAAFWASAPPEGMQSSKLKVAFSPAAAPPPDAATGVRRRVPPADAAPLPDVDDLLKEGNGAAARARAEALQADVDGKGGRIAGMRAELEEKTAETARVLDEAPRAPVSAQRAVTDPFGGVSVVAVGLFLLLLALVGGLVFFSGKGVGKVGEKVAESASTVSEKVAESAGAVSEKVAESASAVGEKVAESANIVNEKVSEAVKGA